MNQYYHKQNFQKIEAKFAQDQGWPFAEILTAQQVEEAVERTGISYRRQLFTPAIVLWAWIWQVLANKTCQAVASKVLAFMVSIQHPVRSVCESTYCKARQRLPESVPEELTRQIARTTAAQVPPEQLWRGRVVKIIDASSTILPDTPDNQEVYPQSSRQQPGCGFPLLRFAVMFLLATGQILEATYSPMNVSERRLFRRFYPTLSPGDVVLGDRGCCSYADLALLFDQGNDAVFRLHGRKLVDFRRGEWLGRGDHIVTWDKPYHTQKTAFSAEEWGLLLPTLRLREVRFSVVIPGFRTKSVTVVTTLLNASLYSKDDLANLFRLRWQAELYLRDLKTSMKMEKLSCKSPALVQKELWVYFLAYNLIRHAMWQSGQLYHVSSLRLSFQSSRATVLEFLPKFSGARRYVRTQLYERLFFKIAKLRLPDRPNRIEPRCRKQRPKAFPLLTVPRSQARARLRATLP